MKHFYRLTILGITGLFLSGCSLFPSAWKSVRSGPPARELTPAVTVGPTQTTPELDESVTADLETGLDADMKQIDADLKAIDEEAKNY
jgi:hypothetical protein